MKAPRIRIIGFVWFLMVIGIAACTLNGAPETTPTSEVDATLAAQAATASTSPGAPTSTPILPPTVLTAIANLPTFTLTPFPTFPPAPTNTPVPPPTQIPTAVLPPTAVPPPVAAFTQDTTTGLAPLTVRFTNLSSGVISSIKWDFGDGFNASDFNPAHTFNAPGLYNVILTVTGPAGTSNVIRQISVASPSAPVAAFTPSQINGIAPLTVQFFNQSTGTVSGLVWNFGDGSTSVDQNPSHTFNTSGVYNVQLTITGPGGTSSATSAITVRNAAPAAQPPVAAFTQEFVSDPTGLFVRFSNRS